ncbi:MAG: hypothetical protein WCO56_05015 [Verrucomicrobiota bacterium]
MKKQQPLNLPNFIKGLVLATVILSGCRVQAIPGLQLAVQGTNVLLAWPSVEGQTYIVQYRRTLGTNTPWQTLTNGFPAATETNWTSWLHLGVVEYPTNAASSGTNGGSGGPPPLNAMTLQSAGVAAKPVYEDVTVVKDGQTVTRSRLVPLPPPLPPVLNAATMRNTLRTAALNRLQGGPRPMGQENSGESSDSTNRYAGFYQVVQNGVQLFGIQDSGVLSNVTEFKIEAATPDGSDGRLVNITFSADGLPLPAVADLAAPFAWPLKFTLDTGRLLNGPHLIQAQATWNSGGMGSGVNPFFSASSEPISVTVSNEISYPNWMDGFGQDNTGSGACAFVAMSATPQVNWQLDVYNSQQQYIGSVSGQTSDGSVEFDWNLVGPGGITNTDSQYASVLTTTDPNTSATIAQKLLPIKLLHLDNWTQQGGWVAARLDMFPANMTGYDTWVNSTDTIAMMAEAMTTQNEVLPVPPARQPGQLLALSCLGTNYGQRASDWQLLKNSLTNPCVRNLYLYAHGCPDAMGDNKDDVLESSEVETFLHQSVRTNAHNFRFVFMDGCKSDGTFWPKAFGIPTSTITNILYFTKNKIRPCAFVGWGADLNLGTGTLNSLGDITSGTIRDGFSYFRSQFVNSWTGAIGIRSPMPLSAALQFAKDNSLDAVQEPFVVRGYTGLNWNEYNDVFW